MPLLRGKETNSLAITHSHHQTSRVVKTLFARSFALIACLHLMGGHWLALQGVAWVTMLVDNSQESSLVDAVSKTFDGQHPCPLCKAVATGQNEEREKKETLVDPSAKLVAVLVSDTPATRFPSGEPRYFFLFTTLRSVDETVPSAPPWVS